VSGTPAERDLPSRIRILISIESGANDGLAFALVALGTAAATQLSIAGELRRVALELGISLVIGMAAGAGTGRLLSYSDAHHDIEHTAFLVLTIALAAFVLGLTGVLGGQGLIAVFVSGLAYNHEVSRHERKEEWEVQEAINTFMVLPVFVLLGVALPWTLWTDLSWPLLAFTAAVLLLRRVPLLLALGRPLHLPWHEALFTGWFGPVGIAALYYLSEGRLHEHVGDELWAAGTLVIAVSTLLHGLTGTPSRLLMARARTRPHRGDHPQD
jgi:sodium/hydrogen antiporter